MSNIQVVVLNKEVISAYGFTYAYYEYYDNNNGRVNGICAFHEYESRYYEDLATYEFNIILKIFPPCVNINNVPIDGIRRVEINLQSGPHTSVRIIVPHSSYSGHLSIEEYYIKIKIIVTYESDANSDIRMQISFDDRYRNIAANRYSLYKENSLSLRRSWRYEERIQNKNYTFSYSDNTNNQGRYEPLLLNKNDRIATMNRFHMVNLSYMLNNTVYDYDLRTYGSLYLYSNNKQGINKVFTVYNLCNNLTSYNINVSDPNLLDIKRTYGIRNIVVSKKVIHNRDGTSYVNRTEAIDGVSTIPVCTNSSFTNVSPKLYFHRPLIRTTFGNYVSGQFVYVYDFLTQHIFYTIDESNYQLNINYLSVSDRPSLDYDFMSYQGYNMVKAIIDISDVRDNSILTLLGLDYNKVYFRTIRNTQSGSQTGIRIIAFSDAGFTEYQYNRYMFVDLTGVGGGYGIVYSYITQESSRGVVYLVSPYIAVWYKLIARERRYDAFRHIR